MTSNKVPVLLLHGYGMNFNSMLSKCGALRSEVKKQNIEWIGLDGPLTLQEAPLPKSSPLIPFDSESARSWYSFANVDETGTYDKFEECIQHVQNFLKQREKEQLPPVRGIFAFSQGTIVATAICARGVLSDSLEFVCLASGLLPKDKNLREEFTKTPFLAKNKLRATYHIIGTQDKLVAPEMSKELVEIFAKNSSTAAVVYEFDGGHVIPSNARKSFKSFVVDVLSKSSQEEQNKKEEEKEEE